MDALQYYINIITPLHDNYQPAKLKEIAMSGTNSTISTTMTTYQLFLANNPAWAKDYTIQQVKPHHPNFVWMALLSSGSAISASS